MSNTGNRRVRRIVWNDLFQPFVRLECSFDIVQHQIECTEQITFSSAIIDEAKPLDVFSSRAWHTRSYTLCDFFRLFGELIHRLFLAGHVLSIAPCFSGLMWTSTASRDVQSVLINPSVALDA